MAWPAGLELARLARRVLRVIFFDVLLRYLATNTYVLEMPMTFLVSTGTNSHRATAAKVFFFTITFTFPISALVFFSTPQDERVEMGLNVGLRRLE